MNTRIKGGIRGKRSSTYVGNYLKDLEHVELIIVDGKVRGIKGLKVPP